jgi:L-seryl-tRNA(Ser) seleniumtransferase
VNNPVSPSLQHLPPVQDVLAHPDVQELLAAEGREVVLQWVREALDELRRDLQAGGPAGDREALTADLAARIAKAVEARNRVRLGRVINATGIILHTGLGRAPLAPAAVAALTEIASASNLEVDLATGERRHRGYQLDSAWRQLTGAAASLVVNNNAAATLLALQALCQGREVLLSRGQMIEIGGSFRLPEIFALSGAVLREVGTTNRTRLSDYAAAIGPNTAAILRVHPSNYRVVGFSETPEIEPLVRLGRERGLMVIDDIGSGCLADVTRFGLPAEPTFAASLSAGADLVLGSGDKLLGGPQCGILLGRADLLDQIRQHPLARAVRIDKLTLAALAVTLDLYLRGQAETEIPVLAMLSAPVAELRRRAEQILRDAGPLKDLQAEVRDDVTPVGGGALPTAELPTAVLSLRHASASAEALARQLRLGDPRVIGRIQRERVLLDLRSIAPAEDACVARAIAISGGSAVYLDLSDQFT